MKPKPSDIIKTLKMTGNAAQTADILGIHRSTVYRWKKKARAVYYPYSLLSRGLIRKSTKPHTIYRRVSLPLESGIITLRKAKGYTAEKIRFVLKAPVSVTTIHRILKRKGLVSTNNSHACKKCFYHWLPSNGCQIRDS
jgi:hypothetical protein